jgi:hypothetical protein
MRVAAVMCCGLNVEVNTQNSNHETHIHLSFNQAIKFQLLANKLKSARSIQTSGSEKNVLTSFRSLKHLPPTFLLALPKSLRHT